jgi:hypothetical protein
MTTRAGAGRRRQRLRDLLVTGPIKVVWLRRRRFCDEHRCAQGTSSEVYVASGPDGRAPCVRCRHSVDRAAVPPAPPVDQAVSRRESGLLRLWLLSWSQFARPHRAAGPSSGPRPRGPGLGDGEGGGRAPRAGVAPGWATGSGADGHRSAIPGPRCWRRPAAGRPGAPARAASAAGPSRVRVPRLLRRH